MAKFYAVKVGKVPGVYSTWAECEEQVKGYPSASYKSFKTEADALKFIEQTKTTTNTSTESSTQESIKIDVSDPTVLLKENNIVAFVDGSFNEKADMYGYGVVILKPEGTKETLMGSGEKEDYKSSRNVAGEIEATINAINYALVEKIENIHIFHDYEGIEKWATGEWAAKSIIAKDYVSFIKGMEHIVNIKFYKVKAHSGVQYNEEADELAKKALLKKGMKSNDNGSISITGVELEEIISISEILSEEIEGIRVDTDKSLSTGTSIKIQKAKEKITVFCYNTGRTTIQGNQSSILSLFMDYVVQLMPSDTEVVELLNDYHDVSIPQARIELEFEKLVPDFSKEKTNDPKLMNTLHQAVYNTLVTGYRPDYTDLVTSGLRALEYYMYKILIDKAIVEIGDRKRGFYYFDEQPAGKFVLQSKYKSYFPSNAQKLYFEEVYNFYYIHRHTLKHWDKDGGTRMISNAQDARLLIQDNLQLINKYYKVF